MNGHCQCCSCRLPRNFVSRRNASICKHAVSVLPASRRLVCRRKAASCPQLEIMRSSPSTRSSGGGICRRQVVNPAKRSQRSASAHICLDPVLHRAKDAVVDPGLLAEVAPGTGVSMMQLMVK